MIENKVVKKARAEEVIQLLKKEYPNAFLFSADGYKTSAVLNFYLEEKTRKNKKVHLITGMESYAGSDKIHYSLLKMHKAWSKVTDEIFSTLNVPVTKKPVFIDGIISVLSNLKRLIFCDILGWKKKGQDFY